MTYSVWADGERIGETRLELRPSPRRRTGAFTPTLTGLARLSDIARPGNVRTLEVRDPAGFRVRSDSIAITDLEQMVAAARARRPGIASEASADVCGPIRFVISLTLDLRDSETRDSALSRAEHLAAQGGQPAAN